MQIRHNQSRSRTGPPFGSMWTLATISCIVAALGASGCSEPQKYAAPTEVCGTKIDPKLLSPLLPPGKDLKDNVSASDSSGESCNLVVTLNGDSGGSQVIQIRRDVVPGNVDPFEVNENALIGYGNPRKADIGNDAMVADQGAIATLDCPRKGQDMKFVLEMHLSEKTPKDVSERRKALERFMRSHLPDARKDQGCSR